MTDTLDTVEFDDDLPASILAEIESLENLGHIRAKRELQRKRKILQIRRNIENWTERKVMRDQIDYLD